MYSTSNAVIRRTAALSAAYLLPAVYLLNDHTSANTTNESVNTISATNNDNTVVTTSGSNCGTNNVSTAPASSSTGTSSAAAVVAAPSTTSVVKKAQQIFSNTIYQRDQLHLSHLFQSGRLHLKNTPLTGTGIQQSFANYFNFWNIHLLSRAHCDGNVVSNQASSSSSGMGSTATSTVLNKSEQKLKIPLDSAWFLPLTNHHDPAQSSCRMIAKATYPANNPTEDRSIFGSKNGWAYGAVFDGHGGWQISDIASRVLLNLILNKLENNKTMDEIELDQQISQSFQEMEDIIVESIRPAFQFGFSEVGKVGSCVLIALKKKGHLIIANCGDCRAVLGSMDNQSNSSATKLNHEHNCREALEQIDLKRNHPNEADIVVCKNSHACYVKGRLQLTRSLGDAYLKYREFNGSPDKSRGRYIPEPYTPPYVSHLPDIMHIRLQPNDRFLILGTDGLWDYLPNAEAVEIVRKGIQSNIKEDEVATMLVERALEIAAEESGMTLAELKRLNPGRQRRSRHDDTTAVVMYF